MLGAKGLIFMQMVMNSMVADCHFRWRTGQGALKLNGAEFKDIQGKYDVALVNFYHKDCHHSEMFISIYDEAADIIKDEFSEDGTILMGKVDCAEETDLIDQQDIVKFPTLRLFRPYNNMINEYRGPRTLAGLLEYVRNQLKDPIVKVKALEDLNHINWRRRNVIGYFSSDSFSQYESFQKVARAIGDACDFYAAFGEMAPSERKSGNKIVFRAIGASSDIVYSGSLDNFDNLIRWTMADKCYTMVTEMTFEKAEEAAEFRRPLLILFHHPDDVGTKIIFHEQVKWQLLNEITRIKFMTADGLVFQTPLQRLGKTEKDLPLLVLDSFQHMYVWLYDPKKDLSTAGLLRQFIDDLHSGKLHELYHEQHPEEEREAIAFDSEPNPIRRRRSREAPIKSEFVKLVPSSNRFTFVQREEL